MTTHKIAIYPGDGIGVDVTDQVVRTLECLQSRLGDFSLEMTHFDWSCKTYQTTGVLAPDDFLDQLRPFDAIFLGALGDPAILPDHVSLIPLIQLRQQFDQYACVRPTRLFPGVTSPLANPGNIDMLVVRENSEGEYVSLGGRMRVGQPEESAVQTSMHTRKGVERILRFGFTQAQTRRKKLTMVTKSNALKYSMVMWDEILEEMKPQFPDVDAERMHVDAAAMNFVRWPDQFDVVVASNLFGDILTDLAGAISGGLGLAPSANINPECDYPSMFEPVHGSAPDIVGKGIANPSAALLSGAMMLDWLKLDNPAKILRQAVAQALEAGQTTPDLGGSLTTSQMTDAVIKHIETIAP